MVSEVRAMLLRLKMRRWCLLYNADNELSSVDVGFRSKI